MAWPSHNGTSRRSLNRTRAKGLVRSGGQHALLPIPSGGRSGPTPLIGSQLTGDTWAAAETPLHQRPHRDGGGTELTPASAADEAFFASRTPLVTLEATTLQLSTRHHYPHDVAVTPSESLAPDPPLKLRGAGLPPIAVPPRVS